MYIVYKAKIRIAKIWLTFIFFPQKLYYLQHYT